MDMYDYDYDGEQPMNTINRIDYLIDMMSEYHNMERQIRELNYRLGLYLRAFLHVTDAMLDKAGNPIGVDIPMATEFGDEMGGEQYAKEWIDSLFPKATKKKPAKKK